MTNGPQLDLTGFFYIGRELKPAAQLPKANNIILVDEGDFPKISYIEVRGG